MVGDQSQAILSVQYIQEQSKINYDNDSISEWQLRERLKYVSPFGIVLLSSELCHRNPVQLDKDIDIESLRILIGHGLDKTSAIYSAWKLQFDQDCHARHDEHMKQQHALSQSQKQDPKFIAIGVMRWLAEHVVKQYQYVLGDDYRMALS